MNITEPNYVVWQNYKPYLKRDRFLGKKPPRHPTPIQVATGTCNTVNVDFSPIAKHHLEFPCEATQQEIRSGMSIPDNMSTSDWTLVKAKDAIHTS